MGIGDWDMILMWAQAIDKYLHVIKMMKTCNSSRISLNILDNFCISIVSGTGLNEGTESWTFPSTKTAASLVIWWKWTLKNIIFWSEKA